MPEGTVTSITFTGQGSGQYGLYHKYDVVIDGQQGSWIIGKEADPQFQPGDFVTYDSLSQNGKYLNWKNLRRAVVAQPPPPPPPPRPQPQPQRPQAAPKPPQTIDTQLSINRAVALKAAVELDGHQTQIDAHLGNDRGRQERVKDTLATAEELLEWVLTGKHGKPPIPHLPEDTTEAPPIEVYEEEAELAQFQSGGYSR